MTKCHFRSLLSGKTQKITWSAIAIVGVGLIIATKGGDIARERANEATESILDTVKDITEPWDTVEDHPTYEELEDAILDDMAKAFSIVESGDRQYAYNHKENAAGCLQIRPIMVREVNDILGEQRFTLEDRWDRNMSCYMFEVIMRHHNPELDIDAACDIWNPNCSWDYRERVKLTYLDVMAQSLETRGY